MRKYKEKRVKFLHKKFWAIFFVLLGLIIFLYLLNNFFFYKEIIEDNSEIPILVLAYLPHETFSPFLSERITGIERKLLQIKLAEFRKFTENLIQALEQITSLNYLLIDEKYPSERGFVAIYKEMPYNLINDKFCNEPIYEEIDCLVNYEMIIGSQSHLEKKTGHDVCYYVDKLGVKEVWIYGYHGHYNQSATGELYYIWEHGAYELDIIKSSLVIGRKSKYFKKDYNLSTFSDVDWIDGKVEEFLPICEKSYKLYTYDYASNDYEYAPSLDRVALKQHLLQMSKQLYWINESSSNCIKNCVGNFIDSIENYTSCMQTSCSTSETLLVPASFIPIPKPKELKILFF